MGLLDPWKKSLSKGLDFWGTKISAPEWGISEALANEPAPGAMEFTPYKAPIGPTYTGPQTTTQQPQQTSTGGATSDWARYHANEGAMPAGYSGEGGGGSSVPDLQAQQRGEIEGGYNNYFSQLDAMMGGLEGQKSAQEGMVGSQYQQGVADLGTEKQLGMTDLGQQRTRTESSQAKNLADLAESIRNQFLTGQVMLGARGAGDSSAVNQYSYALTKMGSKARGDITGKTADIMGEIDNREFKLNTIFSNEKTRLGSLRDQKVSEIAQWFSDATNQIRQMQAQGQISKGQDLAGLTQNALNYAIQQMQQTQSGYTNQQSMLQEWAANNASNITQLRQNMQGVAKYSPNMPQFTGVSGQPSFDVGGNLNAPIGFGVSEEEKQV